MAILLPTVLAQKCKSKRKSWPIVQLVMCMSECGMSICSEVKKGARLYPMTTGKVRQQM
jgi:hypothetical protein